MKNYSPSPMPELATYGHEVRLPKPTKSYLLIIAVVAALIVPCALFFSRDGSSLQLKKDDLFTTYFSHRNSFGGVVRGSSDSKPDNALFDKADVAMSAENYSKAVGIYNAILENPSLNEPQKRLATFQLGVAHLGAGEMEEAGRLFYKIMDYGDPIYFEGAQWYLALIKIKMNDFDAAKQFLKALESGPGYQYSRETKLLLRDLARVKD